MVIDAGGLERRLTTKLGDLGSEELTVCVKEWWKKFKVEEEKREKLGIDFKIFV